MLIFVATCTGKQTEVEVEGGWVLLPRGASGVGAAPPPAAALASSA